MQTTISYYDDSLTNRTKGIRDKGLDSTPVACGAVREGLGFRSNRLSSHVALYLETDTGAPFFFMLIGTRRYYYLLLFRLPFTPLFFLSSPPLWNPAGVGYVSGRNLLGFPGTEWGDKAACWSNIGGPYILSPREWSPPPPHPPFRSSFFLSYPSHTCSIPPGVLVDRKEAR